MQRGGLLLERRPLSETQFNIEKEQIMNQQRQPRISIGWLVATAIVLASAGVSAESMGNVQSGGGSVNEVYGRASAAIPGANPVRSISSKVNVS